MKPKLMVVPGGRAARAARDTRPAEDPLVELASRAAGGDKAAVRALLASLGPSMTRVIRAVLGPTVAQLDDVLQESLLAVFDALPRFRGEAGVRHYACRIAVRIAVRARRRHDQERRRIDALREVAGAPQGLEGPCTPEREHGAARRREVLRGLLADLPVEQADALVLRVVLGCSLPEIAETMDVPVNTVRSRIRLAREALCARIESDPRLEHVLEVSV